MLIAGIDEAGRGPLAGPVVAAAVILPFGFKIEGLKDSKKLTARKREKLAGIIKKEALCFGVGIVSQEEIDRINILKATQKAMAGAVKKLSLRPQLLLIDGTQRLEINFRQEVIKRGDEQVPLIAAASIIAKVTRDELMLEFDRLYPEYNLARHKGYGTKEHLALISKYGPAEIHRKTFKGVKEYL